MERLAWIALIRTRKKKREPERWQCDGALSDIGGFEHGEIGSGVKECGGCSS